MLKERRIALPKLLLINPVQSNYKLAKQGFEIQPLNLAYLAALTPEEWKVSIKDENVEPLYFDYDANLVGITTLTSNINRAYEIAALYKKQNIPVVLGGIHASMLPDEALKYADSVVVGEAEAVWLNVIRDSENKQLKQIYQGKRDEFKRPIHPRRDLLSNKYTFGSIQTSRGCPFDCEFCSVKAFNGPRFRQRDVDDVINEIRKIPQKLLFFTDDNLVGYNQEARDRAKEIFSRMIDEGINKKWFCQTSMNFADDEAMIELAAKSGCVLILVGIESIDEKVLKGNMNKRINTLKGVNYYYEFIKKVHKFKIAILGTMIFGNEEADRAIFDKTTAFYRKSGLDIPWPGILTPYPGTKLFRRLEKENKIVYRKYPHDWQEYNKTLVIDLEDNIGFYNKFEKFIRRNFTVLSILKRCLNSLLYSRNIFKMILVYNFNMSLRRRFKKGLVPPVNT